MDNKLKYAAEIFGFDPSTILPMTPDDLNRFVLKDNGISGLFYIKDNGDKVRLTYKSNPKTPLAVSTIENDLGVGWLKKIFPGALSSDDLKERDIKKDMVENIDFLKDELGKDDFDFDAIDDFVSKASRGRRRLRQVSNTRLFKNKADLEDTLNDISDPTEKSEVQDEIDKISRKLNEVSTGDYSGIDLPERELAAYIDELGKAK